MGLQIYCINYYLLFIIFALIAKSVFGYVQQNVSCFFQSEPGDCTSTYHSGFIVPASILEAYNNLQPHIRSAFENGKCDLSDADFQSISPVLLNLVPVHKLSCFTGSTLATVVNKYFHETSLTIHIMEALTSPEQRSSFLKKLPHQGLSKNVVAAITQSMNHWKNNFKLDMFELSPSLLMSFPPEYLWGLSDSELHRFLHITSVNTSGLEVSQLTKRILAFFALKNPYLPALLMELIVTGFTADELGSTKITKDKYQLDFDLLQARAIFKNLLSTKNTMMLNLDEYLPLLPKLTPELLQKFNIKKAHFAQITKFPKRESCATAIQIAEFIITKAIDEGKLHEHSKWTEKIKYLEKWAYTLPPSTLNGNRLEELPPSAMQKLESPMLSDLQIYYLTNEGKTLNLGNINSILSAQTLLSSLPASQLISLKTGSIQSRILKHLLMYLPGNNVPRTVTLLQKIWTELDNSELFKSLLLNKDVNNILTFVPSWVIRKNVDSIIHIFKLMENRMAKTIQNLPSQFLAVLLREEQAMNWGSVIASNSYHLHNVLLLGLTCDDVNTLQTEHFIIIMDHYNQMRISNNKVFPKNLQYCCLKKLTEYLQLKSNLTKLSKHLINVMEPMEINAVGGYVLAGLPIMTIQASLFSDYILMSISKLSVGELITAVGRNLEKLKELANTADTKWHNQMSQNGNATFYFLGNLLWFIAPENLTKHSTDIRVTIESKELDHRFCGTEDERTSWSQYLISLFGSPDSWSSSVLSCLGDLLIIFSEEQLQNVRKESWIDAADTMPSHLDEVTEWVQPLPFYQMCTSALGESEGKKYLLALKSLIGWKLKAAQWQLDTVRTTSQIHRQNMIANPISFDQNPFKPLTQRKVKKLNSTITQNSKYTLCKNCTQDDDLETSLGGSSQPINLSSTTLVSGNNINNTISKINKENVLTTMEIYTDENIINNNKSGQNIMTETYNHVNTVSDTNLNSGYVSSSPVYTTIAASTSLSSTEFVSSSSSSSSSSPLSTTEVVSSSTEHTSVSIQSTLTSTESTSSSTSEAYSDIHTVSEVTSSKRKLSQASNGSDNTESSQDVSGDDGYAVDGSFTVIDTNASNERSKREVERIYNKISCNALIVVGTLASVTLSEDDINNMPDTEIADCVEIFGKMNLEKNLQYSIWKRIHKLQAGTLPMHILGNLVQEMKVADVWSIEFDFSVPWVLEAVHALSQNTDHYMVEHLVTKIKHENTVEHIGSRLSSLGNLICNFDVNVRAKILEQIQYAVVSLGKIKTCLPCLSNLTKAVITYGGTGDVRSWKSDDVSSLGTIVAGVNQEQWLSLVKSEHHPLSGLQPHAARCLTVDQLKDLDRSVLSIMPPLTLEAIETFHLKHLNGEQTAIIESVRNLVITTDLLAVKENTTEVKENIKTDSGSPSKSWKRKPSDFMVVLTVCFLIFSSGVYRIV